MSKKISRERYEVEWQELTLAAQHRQDEESKGGELYEHDRDADERTFAELFMTLTDAIAFAHRVVKSGRTVYGHATIQLQRYLPIEGTVYFDWEPIGDPEYVEGGGD